jgi:hypothetical protein
MTKCEGGLAYSWHTGKEITYVRVTHTAAGDLNEYVPRLQFRHGEARQVKFPRNSFARLLIADPWLCHLPCMQFIWHFAHFHFSFGYHPHSGILDPGHDSEFSIILSKMFLWIILVGSKL